MPSMTTRAAQLNLDSIDIRILQALQTSCVMAYWQTLDQGAMGGCCGSGRLAGHDEHPDILAAGSVPLYRKNLQALPDNGRL